MDDDEVVYRQRFLGTFAQRYSLEMFPFDTQQMEIILTSKKTENILQFAKHTKAEKKDILWMDGKDEPSIVPLI